MADFVGLEVVEFVIGLERTLGVSIPDHDFESFRTPRELVAYLASRVPYIDPQDGGPLRRWTMAELEQVVTTELAKHSGGRDFNLDTDLRGLFP